MSISHMFGSSHSKVLWQIERVPKLGGDLTMAASALKCYSWLSFLCIFSYMLLKKMLKENMFYYCKINVFNPFRPQCTLSLPLKTSRFIFVYFIRIAANFQLKVPRTFLLFRKQVVYCYTSSSQVYIVVTLPIVNLWEIEILP